MKRAPPQIRAALPEDVPSLCRMLDGLAAEDGLTDAGAASAESVESGLFGPYHFAEALVWEEGGRAVALALFFQVPPGFYARSPSLFLEHLWVDVEVRRRGIGRALLDELGRIVVERGLAQLEWSALTTNQSALAFYRRLGAETSRELVLFRLPAKS